MNKIKYFILNTIVILIIVIAPFGKSASQDSFFINGKGMYLWQLWNSEGGGKNLTSIITKLKSLSVTWVVIKMGDGDSNYNSPNHSLYNWAVQNYKSMDSVTSIFHANGIKLLAFQYVYGVPHHWGNAASETDVANSILSVKGLDGLLIDAEIEYDVLSNNDAVAQAYCDNIHSNHPDSFLGLTAWARINGHNSFPWTTFLDRVDVNMPQTYWAARPTTPSNELSIMSSQFTSYTNTWVSQGDSAADKPIMPIGQGEYFGYSNDVKSGDITSFCNLSQSTYNYPGVSLWEYNQITHSYVWDEYAASWIETPVSVELVSFKANKEDSKITLSWETETEKNNEAFEIEKSIDNKTYTNIGRVSGNGTTTEKHSYSYVDNTSLGVKLYYRLKQLDFDGNFTYSKTLEVTAVPIAFNLSQNYPNPFNPSTVITWQSPIAGRQTIKVYNILGNEVATLVDEYKPAGTYKVEFSASSKLKNLASGVYFYQLKAGNFIQTKKMILMK